MASLTGFVVYAPLLIGFILVVGESTARELRPSDHGLVFQISPPKGVTYPPAMMSFFNGKHSTATSTDFGMPKALNSNESSQSWWGGDDGGGRRDHLRGALMVGSLVCGITGVILLVVSGLLYVFKYRKHKSKESSRDNENDNNHNKLELVLSNP